MKSTNPMAVTGTLVDDVHTGEIPMCITQAQTFVKGTENPLTYFDVIALTLTDPSITKTIWASAAKRILNKAVMQLVNVTSLEMGASAAARKAGNTKATKPADLYRKYSASLRKAMNLDVMNSFLAKDTLRELFLEQTLSTNDLENPDYIDPYTRKKEMTFEQLIADIPEQHEIASADEGWLALLEAIFTPDRNDGDGFDGVAPLIPSRNTELEHQAAYLQEHEGWSEKNVQDFLKANVQFIGGEDEYEPEEDRGFVPATLQDRELKIDRSEYYGAMKLVQAFNKRRGEIFDRMRLTNTKKQDWYTEFRLLLTVSDEYADLLNDIDRIEALDITTAAAVVLPLVIVGSVDDTENDVIAGDGYGLIASDLRPGLRQYLEAWWDDLLEVINDASPSGVFPTSERDIEQFDEMTLKLLTEKMPIYDDNPMQTQSWNMAYLQALENGATFQEADESAWAGWRVAMSPEAATEYSKSYTAHHDRKQAMRTFWRVCPLSVPRPQEHIKAIQGNKMGLVLVENERRIDWRIAAIKARQHELALTEDIKTRLKTVLENVPQAAEFVAAL